MRFFYICILIVLMVAATQVTSKSAKRNKCMPEKSLEKDTKNSSDSESDEIGESSDEGSSARDDSTATSFEHPPKGNSEEHLGSDSRGPVGRTRLDTVGHSAEDSSASSKKDSADSSGEDSSESSSEESEEDSHENFIADSDEFSESKDHKNVKSRSIRVYSEKRLARH